MDHIKCIRSVFYMSKEFQTNKPTNIISTFVSIYNSEDLFVKELQVLLAQRLRRVTRITLSVRYVHCACRRELMLIWMQGRLGTKDNL